MKIAEAIRNGLMSQDFVDWYENTFVPKYVEEGDVDNKVIDKEIREVFKVPDAELPSVPK